MSYKSSKNVAIGALIGLAAGYVMGILTAPKSGKETREELMQAGSKAVKETEQRLRDVYAQLDDTLDKAAAKARDLGERGLRSFADLQDKAEDAKRKVRELIYAVQKGEANDPDLQDAIHEALRAKNDLVEYLKK